MREGEGWKVRLRREMFIEQAGLCALCNCLMLLIPVRRSERAANFDHIIPVSFDGTWERENLRLTHRICNSMRGNGTRPVRERPATDAERRERQLAATSNAQPFTEAWLLEKGYLRRFRE
jgi:5-methylcytosine-specific restriction endonuclease McrA